jgi:hypothetical protein
MRSIDGLLFDTDMLIAGVTTPNDLVSAFKSAALSALGRQR